MRFHDDLSFDTRGISVFSSVLVDTVSAVAVMLQFHKTIKTSVF